MSLIKQHIEENGTKSFKAIGDSIKAIDGNRFGGYLVRYTSEDDKDLHGEWFSKSTNLWLKEHPLGGKPQLLDHAFDVKFAGVPIGILDFAEDREIGLWIEGKLKEREDYEEMLEGWRQKGYIDVDDNTLKQSAAGIVKAVKTFFDTGKAQFSSGALPQSVVINEETGHIDSWAIIESTAVLTPAEPDGTEIKRIKSAFQVLDDILNSVPTATATKETNQESKESEADNAISNDNLDNEDKTMKLEEMLKLLKQLEEAMTSFGTDAGVPEDDAERMADEVTDEMSKMDDDEAEKMSPETMSDKAFDMYVKRIEDYHKSVKDAQVAFNQKASAWQTANGASKSDFMPNATGKSNGANGNGFSPLQIRDITPYDNWKPEDFSFALDVARKSSSMQQPLVTANVFNKAFVNQFADKAIKAHRDGNISLNASGIKAVNAIKANELDYSTQAGFGDEWVFTSWTDRIWDKPRLDLVYNQLQVTEMTSNPYEIPSESSDPTVYFVGETTDEDQLTRDGATSPIPDSKIGTSKVQLNAKKFALRSSWSAELDEDAIGTYLPKFRAQAQRAIEDSIELVALLGDTSTSGNINDDGETPAATDRFLAFDGIVHQALVTATTNRLDAGGNAPTLAHIRSIRSKLGNAQGYNPDNLAIFTDFPTYMKLLSIDAVVTMDKIGDRATVRTGSLGQIDGINIFVSGQMALADTDGKITGAGNATDTGRLAMVYLPDWYLGYRRRITSHLEFLPVYDAWELVMTARVAMSARSYSSAGAQQSTDDSVSLLYNIGV